MLETNDDRYSSEEQNLRIVVNVLQEEGKCIFEEKQCILYKRQERVLSLVGLRIFVNLH